MTARSRNQDLGSRLSFDQGAPGRRAVDVAAWDGAATELPPPDLLRADLTLPELSQGELVRYYTALSRLNFGVDTGPYPLGSCTMKYNPKVNDLVASLPGFADVHPLSPDDDVQGTLGILYELQQSLGAITGLPHVSLATAAGAQGELAGMLMIKHALDEQGDLEQRRRVLVPDSAHGTNPASATMAGFTVTEIPSDPGGSMNLGALIEQLDNTVAAIMVTLPNTLGIWEEGIEEVVRLVHEAGAFVYGDGANLNPLLGRIRFGDLGFDVVHLNLHKTFSTPHGGGGPGAGPVCSSIALAQYLPAPIVAKAGGQGADTYSLRHPAKSIGRLQQFHGNVAVLIRAYAYIRSLGFEGLRATSGAAVLNANYLRVLLELDYRCPTLAA